MGHQRDHPCAPRLPVCFGLEHLWLLLLLRAELEELLRARQQTRGGLLSDDALLDVAWGVEFLLERLLCSLRFASHEDAVGALPLVDSVGDVLQSTRARIVF